MDSLINLNGKKGIILGIANEKSIAWGIAEKLSQCGADLAFSYVNDSIKKRVLPLAEKCKSQIVLECDVTSDSSIDNFFGSKYDLIVSNPPYIKKFSIKSLDDDIRFYEPKIALDGGIDGLSEINKVIKKSSKLLKKNGKLIIEIDNNQVHRVKKMLLNEKFYVNKLSKDFSGKIRNILSTKI